MKLRLAILGDINVLTPFIEKIDRTLFKIYIFSATNSKANIFFDKYYQIEVLNKNEILEICKRENIDGITCFSYRPALETVQFIANELGRSMLKDTSINKLNSRSSVRELLKNNQIGYNISYTTINKADDLEQLDIQYPTVLKANKYNTPLGVYIAHNIVEAKEIFKCFERAIPLGCQEVLLEQYIKGKEISLQYISIRGKHYYITSTDKEISADYKCYIKKASQPSQIPSSQLKNAVHVIERALSLLGIQNAASHAKIIITDNGDPAIISILPLMEDNYIASDLVKLSSGYDYVNNVCLLACGKVMKPCGTICRKSHLIWENSTIKKI